MTKQRMKGWNPTYFGEPKKGSLAAVIAGITNKQNDMVGGKPEVASSVAAEAKKLSKEDRYKVIIDTNKNDKSDDGTGLDAVQPKAVKKKFADRKDKDIDNDGDTDSSDKFLHKRRKAISKAVAKDDEEGEEQDEGNIFSKALRAAKKNGEDTFVVSGKKYKVEDHEDGHDDDEDEKGKDKGSIKVHGEKFQQAKQFKVSAMAKTLADMWKKQKPVE
jgi:hypothetical protein